MITWLFTVAMASDTDPQSHVDQARFFMRQGWNEDAAAELEQALRTEAGATNPEVWFLLSKVRYELCDLDGAEQAAEKARENSADPQEFSQTHDLLAFFREQFGRVELTSDKQGTKLQIELSLESTLLDPDLKNYINRMLVRLEKEPVTLPHTLGLPTASYLINDQFVQVDAGQTHALALVKKNKGSKGTKGGNRRRSRDTAPDRARDKPPKAPKQGRIAPQPAQISTELEIGAGTTAWMGTNLPAAPASELSINVPVGPLLISPLVVWSPQPYRDQLDEARVSASGVFAGVRAGVPLQIVGPLMVRPALVGRAGLVPGLEVGCQQGEDAPWSCARTTDPQAHYVYTTATAGSVGADVGAFYAADQPWSVGLRVAADVGFGRLPSAASALSADGAVDFVVPSPGWSAPSLRALLAFAYDL
ncbi:MAG: hypothetical protein KTR31_00735 [Myxococcales bacterium]|nr:hypothetical protein [Myxococcales bacterium]